MTENNHILYHGDNKHIIRQHLPLQHADLIYIDPPFNTGKRQRRGALSYNDIYKSHNDYLDMLYDISKLLFVTLKDNGSLFLHIDYREAHYAKIILDEIFGMECFMNEIIWAYDYGGRAKKRWSAKHDNILWYAKDCENYTFNYDEMDRIPYMAPGLVSKEKAERGKTPTDVWWHTIVATNGKEKTGYPTQKPLGILERIVKVHSNHDDILFDCFAGSGSFGEAAAINNRKSIMIDDNIEAINVIMNRMKKYDIVLL